MSWYIALDIGKIDLYFPEPFITWVEAQWCWEKTRKLVKKSLRKRIRITETIREGSYEFLPGQICVSVTAA